MMTSSPKITWDSTLYFSLKRECTAVLIIALHDTLHTWIDIHKCGARKYLYLGANEREECNHFKQDNIMYLNCALQFAECFHRLPHLDYTDIL